MLVALLLLSAGVTMLQIACNGVMATRPGSDGGRAVSRYTLLQAFNALGTVIGPLVAAPYLLGDRRDATPTMVFAAFAIGFGALALAFALNHELLPRGDAGSIPTLARLARVLRHARMARGAAAIFAYVGAEVTIGTLAVSYLMRPDRLHVGAVAAGQLVSLYWGGAMVGRFAGAWALARVGAPRLLGCAAVTAMMMLAVAIVTTGPVASAALLATGFCNSIMFPTIYALAMPDEPADVPTGAMLLCMAVVGGAVVPVLTGSLADHLTLVWALVLPAICYAGIALFARGAGRTA